MSVSVKSTNGALVIAASLCFMAALLHMAIIFGGEDWYRFFGAGETMAGMAAAGHPYPAMITAGIAILLTLWGTWALSGSGVINRLPLCRTSLFLITMVFALRGTAGLILPFVSTHPMIRQNSLTFWMTTSLICWVYAGFFAWGTLQLVRSDLKRRG